MIATPLDSANPAVSQRSQKPFSSAISGSPASPRSTTQAEMASISRACILAGLRACCESTMITREDARRPRPDKAFSPKARPD